MISSVMGKSFPHLHAPCRVVEEMIMADTTYYNDDTGFPFHTDLGGDAWTASKALLGFTWSRRVELHEQDVAIFREPLSFGHAFAEVI